MAVVEVLVVCWGNFEGKQFVEDIFVDKSEIEAGNSAVVTVLFAVLSIPLGIGFLLGNFVEIDFGRDNFEVTGHEQDNPAEKDL